MNAAEESKTSLSFGFKRKQETTQLSKSAVAEIEDKDDDIDKDFVLSLEKNELKSTNGNRVKDKKKQDYVIPLINQNRWRTGAGDDNSGNGKNPDDLELEAAKEILRDSARLNDEWDQKGTTEDTTRAIPLLMQNKIPDGFETDNKLDVNLRPEEPNDADYDEIPIEHFGMAMLRGMGWSETRGVGKDGKVIAPMEAHARPKGLGLGADRSNKETNSKSAKGKEENDSEKLELKKGSCCVISAGTNKDRYGIVEGIDEDNSRVMVKLALNSKTINIIQCSIKLVSKKEYDKFSKYLNKQKADKYKEEEEKRNEDKKKSQNGYDDRKHSHKRHRTDKEQYEKQEKQFKSDHKSDKDKHKHSKHSKDKHKSHKRDKDYKYEKDKSDKSRYEERKPPASSSEHDDSDSYIEEEQQRPWLQPDLRVRVVDKSLRHFYKEKVVIVDVPSPGYCVCKSSNGKVLENISQSSLETVIPRDDNSFVLIVSGSHRRQVGQIMKRDKDQCLALVQLLSDRDVVLKLGYDEVCEYVGDVHARDDY